MTVTPTLYHAKIREHEESKKGIYAFISCVQQHDNSAVAAALQGKEGILRLIAKYAITKKWTDNACYYKVMLNICTGGENVLVEALSLKGGWENANMPADTTENQIYTNEWSGSFSSGTLGGAGFMADSWIREAAFLKNDDGSHLTEGQLRVHYGSYMRQRFCDGSNRCGGKCCALLGDTIYWQFRDIGGRVVTRWEPATDDELRERTSWMTHQGGMLARYCELYREDPSWSDDDA